MKNKGIFTLLLSGGLLWWSGLLWAQQQTPDTILYNGKLVTVNDHGINGNLGTIAEAMAIGGDSILAVGSNAQIRALAGPNTKSIDLRGRTVIPGLAITHDHPQDWDPLNPYIVRKVVNDDIHIERFLWEEPPEQQVQMLPRLLEESVRAAKPGQWIRISMLYGKEYKGREVIQGSFGRQITKQMLDMIAPDNPVLIRAGFVGTMVNQKAIEVVYDYWREWGITEDSHLVNLLGGDPQTGVGVTNYRKIERNVIYPPEVLKEILRLGGSWWAGYGITLNSTAMYTGAALTAYNELDQQGQLEVRIPWTWRVTEGSLPEQPMTSNVYNLLLVNAMAGKGSDYLWLAGGWPPGVGSRCISVPGVTPAAQQFAKTTPCELDPVTGTQNRQALYNYIRAGGRLSGAHTDGDKNMDYLLEIVEQASKDAGMTLDQIRAKRHTWDHLAYNPRPDQIPQIKNLGFMLGGWDMYVWEGRAHQVLLDFGEEAAQWVVPRKNLLEAGVRQSVEIDRPLGYTDLTFFTVLYAGITRKDQEGRVNAPQQAVSREVMLKSATLNGAYYTLREEKLGSLEPGKIADLAVLDRDYLTVPVDDIPNIRVLMTMLGGKVVHLVPSLARETGMQPAGSQVELGGPAAQW